MSWGPCVYLCVKLLLASSYFSSSSSAPAHFWLGAAGPHLLTTFSVSRVLPRCCTVYHNHHHYHRSWSRPVAGWSVNNSNGEVAKECWWSMSVGWLVYWFFCPALFLGRQAPSLPTGTDSDRNPTSSYVMSLCNGQHQERTGGIRPGQYTSFISSYSDYYYHHRCHQPSLPSFHSPPPHFMGLLPNVFFVPPTSLPFHSSPPQITE